MDQLVAQGLSAKQTSEPDCISLLDAAGSETILRFSGRGLHIASPLGRMFSFTFDAKNRVESITDPAGLKVCFGYDDAGRLVATNRGSHSAYRFDYDDQGRPARTNYPDGSETRYQHDELGRVVRVVDRNGHEKRFNYNEFGLPSRIVLGPDREIAYFYDEFGELAEVDYADGTRTEYVENDLEGSVEVRRDGRPVVKCKCYVNGERTLFEYPDASRLQIDQAGGRLAAAATAESTLRFGYDAQGLVEWEECDGKTVRYERNAVGSITAILTPDGDRISYERDAEHRLVAIRNWNGQEYNVEYDAAGVVSTIRYPNGVALARVNDAMGLAGNLELCGHTGDALSLKFEYDRCYRLVAEAAADGSHRTYRYSSEAHLIEVQSNVVDLQEKFVLDQYGNCVNHDGVEAAFSATDEIVRSGGRKIEHDLHGGVTRCDLPSGPATLRYNGQGRLVEVITGSGVSTYGYDPIGRRTWKQVRTLGGETISLTRYIWTGTLLLSEETERPGEAVERRRYLPAPDWGIHLSQNVDGVEYCIHHGRRQEAIAMTDSNGSLVWRADYAAFGSAKSGIRLVDQPFRLAGQYFDDETGLHYNLARYYHPQLGRYLQRDPLGYEGGGWNDYIYGDGDPLNRTDPTGEFIPILLAGAAIGGAIGAGLEAYRQHKANPNAPLDWGKIGKEAMIGGAIGTIGAVVGIAMAPIAGALGTGLLAAMGGGAAIGGVSAAIEACAEAAIRGVPLSPAQLLGTSLMGVGIGAITAGVGGLLAGRANRAAMLTNQPLVPKKDTEQFGVTFFDEEIKKFLTKDNAVIGLEGKPVFFMPLEDAKLVRSHSDAARYTGMAPRVRDAYISEKDIYGLSFPTDGMKPSQPTIADAGNYAHFLEGGHTAVLTGEGAKAGYLVNPTRELVVSGGKPVPKGAELFKLGPKGERVTIRKW